MAGFRRALFLGAALAVGLGITWFFVARSELPTASGAFESGQGRTTLGTALLAAYGFLATLVGVALGSVYRRLIEMKKAGIATAQVSALLKDIGHSTDFLLAIVGSPIVFGLLWQSLGDISIAGLTLIALQNGFSSHAVLEQALSKSQPKQASG